MGSGQTHNGFEIDMLSLGKADCVLVTKWDQGQAKRMLIDGGNRSSADKVLAFLKSKDLNVSYIDHVVCSHPHDDHAGGLIDIVGDYSINFGKAWMHTPSAYVDLSSAAYTLGKRSDLDTAKIVEKSLATTNELLSVFQDRGIPIEQPFAGKAIGFMMVCGPTEDYYEDQVVQFTDERQVESIDLSQRQEATKAKSSDALFDDPITTPQNNSSAILATVHDDKIYLFTADAGAQALSRAKDSYNLEALGWMQLPHHGSRHNISPALISHFRPKTAYVSAPGNVDHPRRAVINAFKDKGSSVYSTHYPNRANIWRHEGNVPSRPSYTVNATSLWNAG